MTLLDAASKVPPTRDRSLPVKHGTCVPVPLLLPTIAAYRRRMQAAQVQDVRGVHLPQLSRLGL